MVERHDLLPDAVNGGCGLSFQDEEFDVDVIVLKRRRDTVRCRGHDVPNLSHVVLVHNFPREEGMHLAHGGEGLRRGHEGPIEEVGPGVVRDGNIVEIRYVLE